jgi:RNA-directed DNA polymerase
MKNKSWKNINWSEVNLIVYDLQRKIFKASVNGSSDIARMRYYQKTLVNSEEAKLVAVRKVTQDNRGKKTPGVDGKLFLSNPERIKLAYNIRLDGSTDSIRRVYMSRGNSKRVLEIPTIKDRAKQTLLKLALEPEWEARFDPNSFGFRPGYSAADAKWMLTRQIQGAPKYFLDAYVKGCFDNISHEYLLNKLNTIKMFENQIRCWLKAGILNSDFSTTTDFTEGRVVTPEGGVITPLLANIALDGMEQLLKDKFKRNVCLIRYADDFVVLSKKEEIIIESKKLLLEFLKPINLGLSEEKTKIGHTLYGSFPGLDFLGFNFRNHQVSIHRGVKSTRGVKQNFIQITKPSRSSIKEHKKEITALLKKYKSAPLISVVEALSEKLKGWTYYYSLSQCTKTFTMLDGWLWHRLWHWAVKRFKSSKNAKIRCFSVSGWKFGFIDDITKKKWVLNRYDQVKVRKHVKIKQSASIYDGQIEYFSKRLALHHPLFKRLRGTLVNQGYKCAYCKVHFLPNDVIELHHIRDSNGVWLKKFQFVHSYCHDQIHDEKSK